MRLKMLYVSYLNPADGIEAAFAVAIFALPLKAKAAGISRGASEYEFPLLSFSGILIDSAVFLAKSALNKEPFGECLLNNMT